MLLLVTNRRDLTADWLILELERRGTAFVRFNTEDYPALARITWSLECPATLDLPSGRVSLEAPLAIWYRRPVAPEPDAGLPGDAAIWAANEAAAALAGVWRTLDARWVNHPDANLRAAAKLDQLSVARALGFAVPATLVTGEPREARAFAEAVGRPLICKPIDNGYLTVDGADAVFYTSPVAPTDLDEVGPEPYLFQELVPKRYDVRVTVIGEEVFAVRIESQAVPDARHDWRRAPVHQLAHRIEDLPCQLADACRALLAHYGLRFGAIDLARDEDGRYRFFELNPNGQWAWVEQMTGLPLRAALADLLTPPETVDA